MKPFNAETGSVWIVDLTRYHVKSDNEVAVFVLIDGHVMKFSKPFRRAVNIETGAPSNFSEDSFINDNAKSICRVRK